MNTSIGYLDAAIKAVCPIHGVDSNRIISFMDEATVEQRAAAQAIVEAWDFDTPSAAEQADIDFAASAVQAKIDAKADNVVQYLRDHTVAECVQYVETNVTNLASAKDMLKRFAAVLCVLCKQEFRE